MGKEKMEKREIEELIKNIQEEIKAIEYDEIQFYDVGWRFVVHEDEINPIIDELGEDLEDLAPSLAEFLRLAIYDLDFEGGYYWLPYDDPPSGVTTPAMRFMALK
ncbi:MAG: hypothetical protein OWS74_03080 [Firmicutes bacterium]|nr:hypothetical protein [Bacillota bacterium]